MRRVVLIALLAVALLGCGLRPYGPVAPGQPVAMYYENPTLLPAADPQCIWETVVDVVDDHFKIAHEEPVRQIGDVIIEGRLESVPQVSPTVLEPWRRDAASTAQRVENTLQSMRHRAVVRVTPGQGGYFVDVAVLKELEDVVKPEKATAGTATFRYDDSLRRVVNPIGGVEITEGWIPQGRDVALEQKIIAQLQSRFTAAGPRLVAPR